MKRLFRQQALLIVVALVLFFTSLGRCGLFDNGESTMAGGVAAMVRAGDWIVPTFNGVPETGYPILAYWFMRISFQIFGINEFAARLPSSVLSVGTALLAYHLGSKLYSPAIGFLAGIIFCTCLAISAFGRAATPESTQIFFETLALTCYVWIVAWQRKGHFNSDPAAEDVSASNEQPASTDQGDEVVSAARRKQNLMVPATWQLAAPMYVAMGLATLAKGPTGFGLPCVTILIFLLISVRNEELEQELLKAPSGAWWRRGIMTISQILRPRAILEVSRNLHLLIGIGIVAAIALPWYLAVGALTSGTWIQKFLWSPIVDRVIGLQGGLIWLPIYAIYVPVVILACCFPWAVFLPTAIYQLRERLDDDEPWSESDRLLSCWLGVWAIDFLLFGAELPNSALRILPAAALILARYLHDWEREEGDTGAYSFNLCCKALGASGIVMILGFYIAAYLYFWGEEWLGLIGAVPLIGAYVAIKFLDNDQRRKVVQTVVVTAVITAVLIVDVAPSRIRRFQDSPQFLADARRFAESNDVNLATYQYFEPSLVFYTGKNVLVLNTSREVADFMSGHRHAFVVTRASKHNELRDDLQSNVGELSRRRNFLGREELILLGHQ